ncbi:uncharacterized protein DS421_11g346180 [Arachis hypogaea]|nr:uncharacterized protein DS421_11g346180 [Arachis hypogaea]
MVPLRHPDPSLNYTFSCIVVIKGTTQAVLESRGNRATPSAVVAAAELRRYIHQKRSSAAAN